MQTITEVSTVDKGKIRHYAYYNDDYGIARLVGGGYYFTPEVGESRLVSYKDANLMLLGHVARPISNGRPTRRRVGWWCAARRR